MTDATLPTSSSSDKQRLARFWTRAKSLQKLYLLVLPTTCLIALLGYYPKLDVVVKSTYRWQPPSINEFIGFDHFLDAFADPKFWSSFQLVFIMLVANLFKMWPGIFAAVALHRISSDKIRYIFQVCFVIPMVIPGMVWLLIWKSFYDPDFGIFNKILNSTGLMSFLHMMDGTREELGVMPQLAKSMDPFMDGVIAPVFGSVWGLVMVGAFLIMIAHHGEDSRKRATAAGILLGVAFLPFVVEQILFSAAKNDASINILMLVIITLGSFIAMMWGTARQLGPRWVIWMFLTFGGLYAFQTMKIGVDPDTAKDVTNLIEIGSFKSAYLRMFLWVAVALGIGELLRRNKDRFAAEALIKTIGTAVFVGGVLLLALTSLWTEPTGQFEMGTPAWLGNKDLVIPALIFWGFPWVGTVGVLIYLAGLQQIPVDVYEAAELDGIGPIGMLFRIELPLILTQVRINLIFMTIGTLTTYEMFLILLGPNGGPDNRGMVPGLYIFSKAFLEGKFGYGCALGMVLFFMILGLTVLYNKYVKVSK